MAWAFWAKPISVPVFSRAFFAPAHVGALFSARRGDRIRRVYLRRCRSRLSARVGQNVTFDFLGQIAGNLGTS
jgi:hypothetical protein